MAASGEERHDHWHWLQQGNDLAALRVLQGQRWENESMRLQELSWLLGAVGRYREMQQAFNQAMGGPHPPVPLSQQALDAAGEVPLEPAEQVVLQAVQAHPIVILNEMHHQVEHRAFGARLIPQLRAMGVETLAWETPRQPTLDEAMETGRVMRRTGGYSFEPQCAELLRAAVRTGMKLVAIDFLTPEEEEEQRREPERGGAIRETAMARHIDELILQRNPGAKLLVWVGGDHACKVPWFSKEWMALRLWRRTGIEPFSIFQLSDSGELGNDDGIYRLLMKFRGHPPAEPMAVRLPAAGYGQAFPEALRQHPIYAEMIGHGMDAAILHSPAPFETATERPSWLQPEGAAEILGVVVRDDAPGEGCLVQALHEAEGDESTPADQVITDGWGRYQLRVRPGRYRLHVWVPGERAGSEEVYTPVPTVAAEAEQTVRRVLRLPTAG
jgi:hypothetical protein